MPCDLFLLPPKCDTLVHYMVIWSHPQRAFHTQSYPDPTALPYSPMLEGSLNLYSAKSFWTMGFTFAIIRIIISLTDLINLFVVHISIKPIITFPIRNLFPLLFKIILCFFLFLFNNASVLHILFYTYQSKCIPLYEHSLNIYFLSSNTLPLL